MRVFTCVPPQPLLTSVMTEKYIFVSSEVGRPLHGFHCFPHFAESFEDWQGMGVNGAGADRRCTWTQRFGSTPYWGARVNGWCLDGADVAWMKQRWLVLRWEQGQEYINIRNILVMSWSSTEFVQRCEAPACEAFSMKGCSMLFVCWLLHPVLTMWC